MGTLDRQVRQAQRRLWLNRWLGQWGWCFFASTCLWTVLLLVDRLFGYDLALGWFGLAGLALSLLASGAWLSMTREPGIHAAVALDHAAGLKERISTGLQVRGNSRDPFAAAVVADAERCVAGLSARKLIPLRWTGSLSYGTAMLLVGALLLLLPEFDLLQREEAQAAAQAQRAAMSRMREVVAQPVTALSQLAEKHADGELDRQVKALEDALRQEAGKDPEVLRREAVKQLDKLQDTLKNKTNEDRFKALDETKKKLRQMGGPEDPKGEAAKLIEAMRSGDFEQAQKELKELQEKLAQRAREGKIDPEQAEQMRKQLSELAQKLQQASEDTQSKREMQNMGLSEKDMERVLNALAKKDPAQLEKLAKELAERLKEQGVTQGQLQKMMEKMAQRQEACKAMKEMGQKMADAAQKLEKGDTEAALDEMGEAGEMLSEMEQLEQQLNELEAQMSQLDEAREGLNESDSEVTGKCKPCGGKGFRKDGAPCPHCMGTGECMSGGGRGAGNRDRDDSVDVDFRNEKARVKTARGGRIISQQHVKGEHLKGKSEAEFFDAASAAEIEATDALNRERIPRAYRKAVRNYFDRLGDEFKPEAEGSKGAAPQAGEISEK